MRKLNQKNDNINSEAVFVYRNGYNYRPLTDYGRAYDKSEYVSNNLVVESHNRSSPVFSNCRCDKKRRKSIAVFLKLWETL